MAVREMVIAPTYHYVWEHFKTCDIIILKL